MGDTDSRPSHLIELRSRADYHPDLASLARNQLAKARQSQELSVEEFAELLTPFLGWPVTPDAVTAWETTGVPPGDVLVAAGMVTHAAPASAPDDKATDLLGQLIGDRFSDVSAIYASRSELTSATPPHALFGQAKDIRIAGLSLNLICQQYSLSHLRDLLESGTSIRCLFLKPHGNAIKQREAEENYPQGHLSALTALNIETIQQRVQNQLSPEARGRLHLATYDETIRFNIVITDNRLCVVQPYLPETRGVDSPTLMIQRRWPSAGLFPIFEQVLNSLWDRSQVI